LPATYAHDRLRRKVFASGCASTYGDGGGGGGGGGGDRVDGGIVVAVVAATVCGLQKHCSASQNGRGPAARGDRGRTRDARQIQNRQRPKQNRTGAK